MGPRARRRRGGQASLLSSEPGLGPGFAAVAAIVAGKAIRRATPSHGMNANCMAWAQSAKGLAASKKRPNASNEGTACSIMEICSLSPPGVRQWAISTLRPGNCAVALVVSSSVFGIAPLTKHRLHQKLPIRRSTMTRGRRNKQIACWLCSVARKRRVPSNQHSRSPARWQSAQTLTPLSKAL